MQASTDLMQSIARAEARWPGLHFKVKTPKEAAAACPFCGMAREDGFLIWQEANYTCRKCGAKGWIDEEENIDTLTAQVRRLQREQMADRRRIEASEKRLTALEQMAQAAGLVDIYHANLTANEQALDYWHDHYGISYDMIAARKLGYCPTCPTATYSDSLTIPVFYRNQLYNIRHRLLKPNGGGKYRPHMGGLPTAAYNFDDVHKPGQSIIVTEGEIKSIVLTDRTGALNIGVMGMQGFQDKWVPFLKNFPTVYVAYDPGATDEAAKVATLFKGRGRVVELPAKPDDFFVLYDGTADDFAAYLRTARPA